MLIDPRHDAVLIADPLTMTALKKGRRSFLRTGIVMAALGALAILFPVASTLAVQFYIGFVLLLAGAVLLAGAFLIQGTGAFFGAALVSLLTLASGAFLLFNPAGGALALTIVIAALFMVHGAFEASLAFAMRPARGWGWLLASALVAISLGVLVAAGLPALSSVLLGVLVGLNFLSTGIAFIIIAWRLKEAIDEVAL